MTRLKNIGLFAVMLCVISLAPAQTRNPDISVITDFRTAITRGGEQNNTPQLNLHELELALQGYLNPYARADVFLAKHGLEGPVEIEEAYATFLRGLPLGLNIKTGKYLVDFGKMNTRHPHAFAFVDRPLLHRTYFGDDGFNDVGINANVLLPTGAVYTNLSVNILKGLFAMGHHHSHEEDNHELLHSADDEHHDHAENAGDPELGYTTRLSGHFQTGNFSNLELGLSGATGIYNSIEKLRSRYIGVDFKYKWRPDRNRALTIESEGLLSRRDLHPDEEHEEHEEENHHHEEEIEQITTTGLFLTINYQFRQRWNLGFITEWFQAPDNNSEKYRSFGIFAGFSPMEESSVIRLLLRQERHPSEEATRIALVQVLFSLGPHKPHAF